MAGNLRRHRATGSPGGLPDWAIIVLVFVITTVWLANFVVSAINPHYNPPGEINAFFPAVVGTILVNAAARRRGDDDDDNHRRSDDNDSTGASA